MSASVGERPSRERRGRVADEVGLEVEVARYAQPSDHEVRRELVARNGLIVAEDCGAHILIVVERERVQSTMKAHCIDVVGNVEAPGVVTEAGVEESAELARTEPGERLGDIVAKEATRNGMRLLRLRVGGAQSTLVPDAANAIALVMRTFSVRLAGS